MTNSKNIDLISSSSTASTRSRLAAFTLLALAPLGCTLQSGDDAQANDLEQVGEVAEAITAGYLPPALTSVPVEIKNVNSGKCLDIAGAQDGATAQQYDCNGGLNQTFEFFNLFDSPTYLIQAAHAHKRLNIVGNSTSNNALVVMDVGQRFMFEKQTDGSFRIAAINSKKCLDVPNASLASGVPLQQYDCHTGTNQRWTITARAKPKNLYAHHSAKCLDVSQASTADNAYVIQFGCRSQANQKFSMGAATVVNGVSYVSLVASHSGKCLDVFDASGSNGARVQQYICNNGDNQKWEVVSQGPGFNAFRNKASGKCIDVAGGSTADNANIQQYTCNTTFNQAFSWQDF
ncbi:MAG: RICIN domain-containing protein [Myxococcales bacterium]